MSNQTGNKNVNDYLNKPPHWLVSHGILLILFLIVTFTIASLFIKVSEPEPIMVSLHLEPYQEGLSMKGSYQFVSAIAVSGSPVGKHTPLLDVIALPSAEDFTALRQNAPNHNSQNQSIPIPYNTLLSPADGVFYYDSLRSKGFVIPDNTYLTGEVRLDHSIEKLLRDTDQLSLIFTDGYRVSASITQKQAISESQYLLFLSFVLPKALTQDEVIQSKLRLSLDIKKSLFTSIIEKL